MKNFITRALSRIPAGLLADVAQGLALTVGFAWLFFDSFYAAVPLCPFVYLWHREMKEMRRRKSEDLFRRQFREWLLLLSSSLSVGYAVENAIGQSYKELKLMFPGGGPMLKELKRMLAEAENNQRPELLLEELSKRHPLEEVISFAEVFRTARMSGGSLTSIIKNTATQMAEVVDTKREIETLLSSKVYEQRIMTVMPAAVLLYLRVGSPDFVEALYHNPAGQIVMVVVLGIYLAAYLVGKRMVQFEI